MAVKIIINRKVPKEKEAELLPLLIELRAKATGQPGYISGETLRNVDNPEVYVVISTWQSVDAWKSWLASDERTAIHNSVSALLGEETEYGVFLYS